MSSSAYNHKTSKNNITFHLTIETASQESLIEMPNEMAILNNSHGKNDDKPWITQQTLQRQVAKKTPRSSFDLTSPSPKKRLARPNCRERLPALSWFEVSGYEEPWKPMGMVNGY